MKALKAMSRSSKVFLLILTAGTAVWFSVLYTGLPKTSNFSLHGVSMIDAGVESQQPWVDSNGVSHPYRLYGFANLLWNQTNISDGFQVESYSFTNIPNVTSVLWDFQTIVAKVENGRAYYESLSPPYTPVFPFSGLSFQASYQSLKNFPATWDSNRATLGVPPSVANISGTSSGWPDADIRLRSEIEVPEIGSVLQTFPSTSTVLVTFAATWRVNVTASASDSGISAYTLGFERSSSLALVMRNGTALSATGNFTVRTGDQPSVPITYRTLSSQSTLYIALAGVLALAVSLGAYVVRNRMKTRRQ